MTDKAPLKVGVIGLGHLHPRLYMPLFQAVPETEVVAACEEDSGLLDTFSRDYGVRPYGSLGDLLRSEELDIAAIFLPHAECPEAACRCAQAGIHLMVEKPMAAAAAGVREIVEAAEAAGVKLTTGYCWRLHPVAAEFRRLLGSGIVGEIVGGTGRCAAGRLQRYIDGQASWMLERSRSGGGPMFNLGVHWIDLFRWLLEDEVTEACGRNVKVNQAYDIEDNSFALLRFGRGAIVSLDISYTVPDSFPYGRDLYLSVRGTRGAISWAPAYEGEKDILYVCSDHEAFAGSPRRELSFELEPVKGYSGFMGLAYVRDFADAILRGRGPAVTGHDGLAALEVVEAVYRSVDQRCWTTL